MNMGPGWYFEAASSNTELGEIFHTIELSERGPVCECYILGTKGKETSG